MSTATQVKCRCCGWADAHPATIEAGVAPVCEPCGREIADALANVPDSTTRVIVEGE